MSDNTSWSPSDEDDVVCAPEPVDACACELDDAGSAVTVFFFAPDDELDFDELGFDELGFFVGAMDSTYLSPGQA
ncbi:MAG: hypothetical protein RIS41_445 [Actinomycetota bacterium]|jgi:hypothetical protein